MCEFRSSARAVWYGFFIACDYWVNLPIKLGFPRAHARTGQKTLQNWGLLNFRWPDFSGQCAFGVISIF
nr:MAG TPA: hypothetical protein [Caudoviricetes sp.]